MNALDWLERWRDGHIPFHLDRVNPWLLRHESELGAGGRVLVPLCGKSLDMGHLADGGWQVTGVDLAEKALCDFFAERGEIPERRRLEGGAVLTSGGVTLVAADFLALTPAGLGSFDAAWDRAALIALAPEVRPRYASHLLAFLKPAGRLLLAAFEYDQALMEGPPYSVAAEEVQRLFAGCDIRLLARRPQPADAPLRQQHDLPEIHDAVWLITRPAAAKR